jgi:hypothetical protein
MLMTATIHPHSGVSNLRVTDPAVRMAEYLSSLRFALTLPRSSVNGVVLAENSGADLTPMRELVGDRDDVELLSLPGSDAASGAGRGWLETQLVDQAVRGSELVGASSDPLVWKTTGRYQVRNLPRLVATARPGGDLYFNLRRHPEHWADMWVYGVTPHGMSLLAEQGHRLRDDDGPAERTMYDVVTELAASGARVSTRFGVEPRISGVRGHDGRSFAAPSQQAKYAVRSVARRVAPSVWI